MTSADREKNQKLQEKYQAVLNGMLREEDNKYCVDCDSKGPRWASWNLGVFLCIRCAGIHRNLGVHISKVKSVNLDQWTAEQIASMQAMGNSKARAVYEANLPDNFRRSQTDSAMEQFIRQKYEQRKYIAKEWIPPNITISPDLTDEEREKEKRKANGPSVKSSKDSKSDKSSNQVKLNLNISSNSSKKSSTSQSKSAEKSISDTQTVNNPVAKPSSDLLNLFDDDPKPVVNSAPVNNSNVNLFDNNLIDIDKQQDNNQKMLSELSVSNDPKTNNNKIDKNSILALYQTNKPADANKPNIPSSTSLNSFDSFYQQSNAQLLQSQIQMAPSISQNFMQNPAYFQQQQQHQLPQLQPQQPSMMMMNKSAMPQNQLFSDLNQLAMRPNNGPSMMKMPMNSMQPSMGSLFDNRAAGSGMPGANKTTANIGNTLSSNLWD